jgi:hypothetical protein
VTNAGGRRRRPTLLALLLAFVTPSLAAQPGDPLPEMRELYYAAVERASAIDPAMERAESLRAEAAPGSELEAVLAAYAGAVTTLRAKHGHWPPSRLRHMRNGLATLDSVVAAHPALAEPRYLRLMSCYYLPAILGRTGSVREDFDALAVLLPGERGRIPAELHAAIVRFVVEHGDIPEGRRRELQSLLASSP